MLLFLQKCLVCVCILSAPVTYAQPSATDTTSTSDARSRQTLAQADTFITKGKPDSAIQLLQQYMATAGNTIGKYSLQKAHLGLGKAYLLREQFDESLQHYLTSLSYNKLDSTNKETADAYIGMGVVYSRLRNFPQAEAYLQKALSILQQPDKDRLKALVNLAGVYMEAGNQQHILPTHQEALALAAHLKAAMVSAVLYTNLSNYYLKNSNWTQAISTAQQSMHIRDSLKKPLSVITLNNLGYALVQSGNIPAGVSYYQQALPTATLNEKKQLLYNLANAMNAAGNYQQAVQYFQQYDTVKDSIAKKQYEQKVAELTTTYETAQKQQRINTLEAENKARKKQIIQLAIGAILLLTLLAGIVYLRFKNLRVKQLLEQSRMKRQLLQVQLNPHFLFNALNHIQQYIYKNDAANSMTYLASFSRLMRLILENSEKEYTTLEEELEMLRHYITLQQSGTPTFDFELQVSPELATDSIDIPIMLLQPFVENAIIHGVKKRENGKLLLRAEAQPPFLHITIADNGTGIQLATDHAPNSLHRSMGSTIVNQRIAEFNKTNLFKIRLQIEPTSNTTTYPGTTVHLYIPVKANEP
ncbi:sensor histidine kinase [Filimonas lacunae]|nr:sensor histidine kinase [Filimonas lacunae]